MNIERFYIHRSVSPSTNLELKQMLKAPDSPLFPVIYADTQTSGRGRLGRDFFSPEGGLYFSAAYPLDGKMKNISFLTLLSGIAVNRALCELYGADTKIKWPNDIYIGGKKLCGILAELTSVGDRQTAVVGIGININVSRDEIPEELKEKMTSLSFNGIHNTDKERLMKKTVEILDTFVYEERCLDVISEEKISFLNSVSFLRNKAVLYNGKTGICRDINRDGSVCVEFSEGITENIYWGEIIVDNRLSPV